MNGELIKLYADSPNYREVMRVVDALRDGEVIIFPTGTGYAYGCDAMQQRSVEQICRLKNIDIKRKSLAVLFENMSDVSSYCKINNDTFKFIKKHHEGFFTYILPAASTLPKAFKNRKEVGARLAFHPVAKLIINELGTPLMTSSLPKDEENPEYASDPELIQERYGHQVNFIVDGGIAEYAPSTVLDCTAVPFKVLRMGSGVITDHEDLIVY
ncbi:L-threonylcarbamoyladenylate synthase [Porphyromonas macacae]|uniref:Translation factor (SUA5) n=1 Tax=Porphyromonas macacae TaxID=28115 RepID=A0A379DGW9_9PORP|nr:L-threonylcarbamoyladenylate synthase [Porphyromonas macacae]SUB77273.1 Putative translation factor (SUA5) [Porphyromonas macacae]